MVLWFWLTSCIFLKEYNRFIYLFCIVLTCISQSLHQDHLTGLGWTRWTFIFCFGCFWWRIIIGYSTVFCKIWDFICMSLRSAETILDKQQRVQYSFCRTKTSANKIQYFTKHCRMIFLLYPYFQFSKLFGPPHDKNNGMTHAHLRPVWSVFAVHIKKP